MRPITPGIRINEVTSPQQYNRTIYQAATGAGIIFTGALFGYGGQFLIGILMTRALGAEQFGLYKIAVSNAEIAAGFALLGMDYAFVRFISLYASRNDQARVYGTLKAGLGVTTILSLLLGLGLFLLASPVALGMFQEPRLIPLLRLASVIVPLWILSHNLACATKGFKKMQYAAGAEQIAQPLTRLILIIVLMYFGLTAGKAIAAYIAGLVVSCILLFYLLSRLLSLRQVLQTGHRGNTRELFRFSLPIYFSTLLETFGTRMQILLLGSLNAIAAAGIFSVTAQVSLLSSMFNQSIGTASSPIVSELHGQGDRTQLANFYRTTTKWMFTINLPMFLLILLLPEPILSVFGSEFLEGSKILIIFAVANLVVAAAGISDGFLAMTGNSKIKMANSLVLAFFSIGLSLLLIPRWGAVGAAAATLVTAIVINLLRVIEVYVLLKMFPYNFSFWKPVAAALVALAVGWIVRQSFPANIDLMRAILNALVITTAYAGTILLFGLSPDDQVLFHHLRARIATAFNRGGS